MERLKADNNISTVLSGNDITSSQTTMNIANGNIFRDGSTLIYPYLLTLFETQHDGKEVSEIVKVTGDIGGFGNTKIIERGQEGTTPRPWVVGSKVENRFTAGMYKDLYEFKGTGGRYYQRVDPVTNAFQLVWEED